MVKHSPYPNVVIPKMPFGEYMAEGIERHGDRVALVDNSRGKSATFSEVLKKSRKCASALRKKGLSKGDVVAICSTNRVEYPMVILAAAYCNAAASPCNPLYQEGELIKMLSISEPRFIFTDSEFAEKFQKLAAKLPSLKAIFTFGKKDGCTSFDAVIADCVEGEGFPDDATIDIKEDVVLLPYSSGTTGLPKSVMLTHYSYTSLLAVNRSHMHMFQRDCFYMVVPMFHTLGFSMTMFCLHLGVKNVFDVRFNMESMLSAFEKYKVTHFSAVPPIMIGLTQTPLFEKYDTSSLKQMFCGAAPVAPQLTNAMIERYKLIVTQAYGLTEGVPLSVADPVTYPPTSVGAICANTIIKVIDVETEKELGPGEDGEILAKGPQIMKGYLKNPEATAFTIDKDGWMHTGDIGHYDEDGFLYVVDRLKELIKYKGFQVAPAEVESALLKHAQIADAAVIGVPDPVSGEAAKAYVVKKQDSLTEGDVKKFIEGELAKFKHLHGGVEFVASIPKSPSGKILRKELRTREQK